MRRTWLCLALILFSSVPALGQTKTTDWTAWLPAKNPPCRTYPGIETHCIDFSYRWRLREPCSHQGCTIVLQIRNNSDVGASVNYTVTIERADGSLTTDKDHWNFAGYETHDVSVDSDGTEVVGVKIEAS